MKNEIDEQLYHELGFIVDTNGGGFLMHRPTPRKYWPKGKKGDYRHCSSEVDYTDVIKLWNKCVEQKKLLEIIRKAVDELERKVK